jgi:hypothetical protein
MRNWLLALVLLLIGCCNSGSNNIYHAQGYVRSVWFDRCRWTLVIEGEDRTVFSVEGRNCELPPVWQGLHGEFQYESDSDRGGHVYKNFQVVKRLQ